MRQAKKKRSKQMKDEVNSNKAPCPCSMCVHSRSTLGNDPHLYCSLMPSKTGLPSHDCPSFCEAFVSGFSVPSM